VTCFGLLCNKISPFDEELVSPTVAVESLFLAAVIDAKEE
jgi:hypothetical protein